MEKIKASQEITVYIKTLNAKLISIKIKPNATFKQFVKQAIQDQELSEVHHCKFCFKGKYLLNTGLDLSLSEHKIENGSTIHMQLAQSTNDKSTIWNLKNLADQPVDNDITLSIWDFGNGKEVTKLSVKKTTTMRDIKKQLQRKYNLSDERINELYLSYGSYNMFCDLDLTVEQVCDKENIEKREVKAYVQSFDFNLKTSEKEASNIDDLKLDLNKNNNENYVSKTDPANKSNWPVARKIIGVIALLLLAAALTTFLLFFSTSLSLSIAVPIVLTAFLVVGTVLFFGWNKILPKILPKGCLEKLNLETDLNEQDKAKIKEIKNDGKNDPNKKIEGTSYNKNMELKIDSSKI